MIIEYFDNPPRTMPSERDAIVIKLRVELIEANKRIAELESTKADLIRNLVSSGQSHREMQEAYGRIFAENVEQEIRIDEIEKIIMDGTDGEAQARIAKLEIEAHERIAELATWRGVALRGRDEWVKAQEYQRHLVAELESRDKEIAEMQAALQHNADADAAQGCF